MNIWYTWNHEVPKIRVRKSRQKDAWGADSIRGDIRMPVGMKLIFYSSVFLFSENSYMSWWVLRQGWIYKPYKEASGRTNNSKAENSTKCEVFILLFFFFQTRFLFFSAISRSKFISILCPSERNKGFLLNVISEVNNGMCPLIYFKMISFKFQFPSRK